MDPADLEVMFKFIKADENQKRGGVVHLVWRGMKWKIEKINCRWSCALTLSDGIGINWNHATLKMFLV